MMTLLGQHGQQQDYNRGVQLIRQAALTADENAPQGAYVRLGKNQNAYEANSDVTGIRNVACTRAAPDSSTGNVPTL
jgi:hypothetical protein